MSRLKEIDFRRVTISLPVIVLNKLKVETHRGNMSRFIADAIEEKFSKQKEETTEEFMESLEKFSKSLKWKSKESSLQILRKIRDGKSR